MLKKRSKKKRAKTNFNKRHPELRKGEVFVINYFPGPTPESASLDDDTWFELRLRSKRMGSTAYNIHGQMIKGARPIFAKKVEYQKKKDRLWPKDRLI